MVVWNTSQSNITVKLDADNDEQRDEPIVILVKPGHGIDFHSIGLKSHQEIMRDEKFKRLPEFKTYLRRIRKDAGETNPELLPDEEAM